MTIYAAFLCMTVAGQAPDCHPFGTPSTFASAAECVRFRDGLGQQQLAAWLDPRYRSSAQLVCMKRPGGAWEPAE